jgi:hypothetical protein
MCQAFSVCNASQYELLPPTANSDRLCRTLTRCAPGFVQDASPTATSDRTCKPCQLGATYETNGVCLSVTPCTPGTEQTVAATLSSNRVCTVCQARTFNADGIGQCNPVATCSAGSFIQSPSTPSSDQTCGTCDVSLGLYSSGDNTPECATPTCEPSQYLIPSQTSTSPGRCSSCLAGTFSVANNTLSCTEFQDCPAGQGAIKEGTTTSDRQCQDCELGVAFSAQESNASCTPVRQCGAGFEERTTPTTMLDRTCQSCTPGLTFQDRNGTTRPCQPVSLCPAGSQVLAPPTISSDRTCDACPDQFYSDRAGTSACKPYSPVCLAGFKQTSPPSRFRDRTCTPCSAANAEYQDTAGAQATLTVAVALHLTFSCLCLDQSSCDSWSTCRPGSFVAVEGTPTSDRSCASCDPGMWRVAAFRPIVLCVYLHNLIVGQHVGFFSISTNVAACTPCAVGTEYQDQANAISCKTVGSCAAGTAVASAAQANRDTICEPCDGVFGYSDVASKHALSVALRVSCRSLHVLTTYCLQTCLNACL